MASVQTEAFGQCGGNIGKGFAHAKVDSLLQATAPHQNGNVFPAVVGAGAGGVTAVVGGDHQQVTFGQPFHQLCKVAVGFGKGGGIAVHIVAVAVNRIKIHQIDKTKAMEVGLGKGKGLFHAVGIAVGALALANAPSGKDIDDFAHTDDIQTGPGHQVGQGGSGGLHRKIVAVGGAGVLGPLPHTGTGDDTAHSMLAGHDFPGNTADGIQFLGRNDLLVGGDLQNAVG